MLPFFEVDLPSPTESSHSIRHLVRSSVGATSLKNLRFLVIDCIYRK